MAKVRLLWHLKGTNRKMRDCWLTTPHKLQGGGPLGKPSRPGTGVRPDRKPMAAP
jgi:hypothetical protein